MTNYLHVLSNLLLTNYPTTLHYTVQAADSGVKKPQIKIITKLFQECCSSKNDYTNINVSMNVSSQM